MTQDKCPVDPLVAIGAWTWGALTAVLAALALVVVIRAGFYIVAAEDKYRFSDQAPPRLIGLFFSLKEHGSLVAGILGFSGLAWAYFFKAVHCLGG